MLKNIILALAIVGFIGLEVYSTIADIVSTSREATEYRPLIDGDTEFIPGTYILTSCNIPGKECTGSVVITPIGDNEYAVQIYSAYEPQYLIARLHDNSTIDMGSIGTGEILCNKETSSVKIKIKKGDTKICELLK